MSSTPRRKKTKHAISLALIFGLGLAFMLCSSALAENERGIDGNAIFLEYDLEKPIVKDGPQILDISYKKISIPGLPNRNIPGEPVVPFKTVNVLIPYGEEVQEIKVIPEDEEYLGKILIEPGQEQVPISNMSLPITTGEKKEPTRPNEAIYASSEPFPKSVYLESGVQSKQGYKIIPIILYPIKYIPNTMDTYYFGSFKIEVVTTPSEKLERGTFRGLTEDKEMIPKIVDNPEVMDTYPAGATLGLSPLLVGQYDYVIVTNQALKSCSGPYNFQALVDWKNSKGFATTIITVEEIYSTYSGQDNQEKIRNFIRDAYQNNGVTYVLLGGDADGANVGGESGDNIVPVRGLWAAHSESNPPNIPSDLYYACLDGNYDDNGNGIYGEPTDGSGGGEVDLYAEVYIGRAPIDSCDELSNFVRKTVDYESATGDLYLKDVWMIGEYLGFSGVGDWGGNYKDEIKDSSCANGYCTEGFPDDFDKSTLYDRDYPGNDWPKSELISGINSNIHCINHLGHANNFYDMKMCNSDVDALTNNKYFIGYSQGCYAGAFDNRYFEPGCNYLSSDCILEHFVTEPSGAFAFIGNSRYGWGVYSSTDGASQKFDRQFWSGIFKHDLNIGVANQYSKEMNTGYVLSGNTYMRFCYYEINLLGDPSVSLKNPAQPATWTGLGGYVISLPNMIVDDQGRVHIFAIGGDHALWDNIDGVWYGLGGSLASAPFPVKDSYGRIHILVRGSDNALWDCRFDTGAWSAAWYGIGGIIAEMPTATQYWGTDNIIIMVHAIDNSVWAFDLTDPVGMSGSWIGLGGNIIGVPYVIEDASENIHTFVIGMDNTLWDFVNDGESSNWYGLGGSLSSQQIMPTAVNEPDRPGYVAVMVRGADDGLWICNLWPDKSAHWIPLGGYITSGGYAITDTAGNIHTFVKGSDNATWENVFSSSPWNPTGAQWYGHGGLMHNTAWPPVAFASGYTHMAVIGSDSAVWNKVYSTVSPSVAASEDKERTLLEAKPSGPKGISFGGDVSEVITATGIPVEIEPVDEVVATTMMLEQWAVPSAVEGGDVSSIMI